MKKRIFLLCFIVPRAWFSSNVAPTSNQQMIEDSNRAKAALTRYRIRVLEVALKFYLLQTGRYPSTAQGLAALIRKPDVGVGLARWNGPYLNASSVPLDGWEHPFVYTFIFRDFEIFSFGADGKSGGCGLNADISSKDF